MDAWPNDAYARNVLSAALGSTVVFVISAFFWRPDDPKSALAIQLDKDLRTPVVEVAGARRLAQYDIEAGP